MYLLIYLLYVYVVNSRYSSSHPLVGSLNGGEDNCTALALCSV